MHYSHERYFFNKLIIELSFERCTTTRVMINAASTIIRQKAENSLILSVVFRGTLELNQLEVISPLPKKVFERLDNKSAESRTLYSYSLSTSRLSHLRRHRIKVIIEDLTFDNISQK